MGISSVTMLYFFPGLFFWLFSYFCSFMVVWGLGFWGWGLGYRGYGGMNPWLYANFWGIKRSNKEADPSAWLILRQILHNILYIIIIIILTPAYFWISINFIPQSNLLFQCEFKVCITNKCRTIYFINNKPFINIGPYSTAIPIILVKFTIVRSTGNYDIVQNWCYKAVSKRLSIHVCVDFFFNYIIHSNVSVHVFKLVRLLFINTINI